MINIKKIAESLKIRNLRWCYCTMCTLITILYMSSGSLGLKYKQIIGNEYLLYCVVFNILFLFISVILLHSIQGILQPEVRTEPREHKCMYLLPSPTLLEHLFITPSFCLFTDVIYSKNRPTERRKRSLFVPRE